MGGDESKSRESESKSQKGFVRDDIIILYNELLQFGYLYKDLYEMTLYELINTLEKRKQGKAYEIWRLASFVHSPFVKNFPSSPKEAMPELFPQQVGIKMPDFLVDKAIKRGVL